MDSWIVRFWDVAYKFLWPLFSAYSMPHGLPGMLSSQGQSQDMPPSVAASHTLCINCHGQPYKNDRCDHGLNWNDEKWDKVSVYLEKLAAQH